jgi:hypothetical protein
MRSRSNYANPLVLGAGVWTLDSMSLLEAFVGGPVEIFFAVRVLKRTFPVQLGWQPQLDANVQLRV